MPFNVNSNTVVTDDRIVQSVSGAVGARPGTPVTGMMFFNTTDSIMEVYNGTTWVSSTVGGGGGAVPNAWGWGGNLTGQLSDNTIVTKSSPVSFVGGFTEWVSTSAGVTHGAGLRANGTVWSWGSNSLGQLGDNSATTASKSSPVSVVGGFTDWVSVSAGQDHVLGLRANGTIWAWGSNAYGKLGDNSATTASKSSPVSVVGGFTDWISIAAGEDHSVGLRANGTIWAWGSVTGGRLGNNLDPAGNKSSPVSVVGGFTNWISINTCDHTLAIRANGTMWAWGPGGNGLNGDNTTVARSSPVSVVGGIVDWVASAAGRTHSMGIRANGTLYAWGGGNQGQLGRGNTANATSPVPVVGGFTDWTNISAGGNHSLGLRANGTLWAWGFNTTGQLGINTADTSSNSPVSVVGGFVNWVSISAQDTRSLGIRSG